MGALKIGVVMDPIEKIDTDKDTTFVLLLAWPALHRGSAGRGRGPASAGSRNRPAPS